MASTIGFLFLLPALVYGQFTIDIDLSAEKPLIDIRGQFSSDINDTIREAFHIADQELIKAVAIYKNDTIPVKVYVKKNEKLQSMYKKHNFYDVSRHVKPVLEIKYNFKHCSKPEKLESDQAEMTITTDWKRGGNLSFALGYYVYLVPDLSKKLTFNTSRGQTLTEKKVYKFGKTVENASKCTLNIDVQFESTLEGDVVAQYPYKRGNHYFWAYDVRNVLKKANSYITEETITVVYFKEHIEPSTR